MVTVLVESQTPDDISPRGCAESPWPGDPLAAGLLGAFRKQQQGEVSYMIIRRR